MSDGEMERRIGKSIIPKTMHLDLRDAVRMAYEKPEFAKDLTANPEKYARIFNLNEGCVDALRRIDVTEFEDISLLGMDPVQFADTVMATNAFLEKHSDVVFKDKALMKEVY